MTEPALTPEEWARPSTAVDDYADMFIYGKRLSPKQLHGLAAVCLYDQPFGFTQEDVKGLREIGAMARSGYGAQDSDFGDPETADWLDSLAARGRRVAPSPASPEGDAMSDKHYRWALFYAMFAGVAVILHLHGTATLSALVCLITVGDGMAEAPKP